MQSPGLLAHVSLFSNLSAADREMILCHGRRRRYRAGEAVFHRGDLGAALYILLAGSVKVHNATGDGRDVLLAVLGPGQCFGELSLLDGRDRSADVTTLEPIEVLVLTRESLWECLRQSPAIAGNLLANLAQRVRRVNEANEALAALDAPGRMARQLLLLAREHGVQTPQGIEIGLRLRQSELAALVSVTRETVGRALSEFRRLGWLTWDARHHYVLLRPDLLAQRSAG
jgi:CRP-like cAMP-binding protein